MSTMSVILRLGNGFLRSREVGSEMAGLGAGVRRSRVIRISRTGSALNYGLEISGIFPYLRLIPVRAESVPVPISYAALTPAIEPESEHLRAFALSSSSAGGIGDFLNCSSCSDCSSCASCACSCGSCGSCDCGSCGGCGSCGDCGS